ncbi:MAG TPA: hypothetical protein VMC43_01240 [Candidatus Paceibacterota bacterium]|nr:hypothetical protein [Candidatus Paceibacterota bacterium]
MSEIRQDIVSGDWVIMVPERAKRPDQLFAKKEKRKPTPKATCPFEDLRGTGNWPPHFLVPNDEKKWRVAVIPNKYPALAHGEQCADIHHRGPYAYRKGVGYHDLVVGRDHFRNIADLPPKATLEIFEAMQRRFRMAEEDDCLAYVSTFFNWGPLAGASLYHPHYQMLTLPFIPPEVEGSLGGSKRYFKKHHRCVHCDVLKYERKAKTRVVDENARAIAVAPFVPKSRMEVSIYPKRHEPFFEKTPRRDLLDIIIVLKSTLQRMRKYLADPDLNFFIHTGPIKDQKKYAHYHWHIDVIPKIFPPPGGFELSTGTDINVFDPDWLTAVLHGRRPPHPLSS